MVKSRGMTEGELVSLLDRAIANNEMSESGEAAQRRRSALKYLNGGTDVPREKGKSGVTSHDFSDTLNWILPSLLRTFLSSEHVGLYEPRKQQLVKQQTMGPDGQPAIQTIDVSAERARQATDFVNYVLMNECRGYSVLHSAFHEGLSFGNGLVKHWWDESEIFETEDFSGLSDDAFTLLVRDSEVELVEHEAVIDEEAAQAALMSGQMPLEPPMIHNGRVKRRVASGRLRVKALAHEDFFIGSTDTVIDEEETLLCGHRYESTRSDLIRAGFERSKVDKLPSKSNPMLDEDKQARGRPTEEQEADFATELVEVRECYVRVDYDGDGVSEWRKVVMGGAAGERSILENEEWGDDLPFTDMAPDPVPHRWRGQSVFDETKDIADVKTVLMRQTIDNLYQSNNPQKLVRSGSVRNTDALLTQDLGELVYTDDINSSVRELVVPFTAQASFSMLEYLDTIRESRTGVSRAMIGLDQDALQNQTATAFQGAQSASYAKQETYARNLAENGMRRLFRCLLRLIVKHQDKPRMIRLRGEWVEMDPRSWDAEMDVSINTGLGSGSRDRDLSILGNILNEQKSIIAMAGPFNEICNVRMFRDTLAKMVEISGLRSPERYFAEVTDQVMEGMKQQAAQASQKPDPKTMEAQARLQLDHAKAQADMQMRKAQMDFDMQAAAVKMQADMQSEREKNAIRIQADRERANQEIQLMRERGAAEIQIEREKAQTQLQLKREEMVLEAELTRESNMMKMAQSQPVADTNIQGPGV